jgi:hypothetical protein
MVAQNDNLPGQDPLGAGVEGFTPSKLGKMSPAERDQSAKDIAICVLVAITEAVLVLVGITGHLSLPTMLLVHCAIMLGVTLVLDQRERNKLDSRVLAIAVVTTAVSGPLGAAMSALLGVYLRYRRIETALLVNWYERISGHAGKDAVVELHERIQAGRTINPYVDARARFAAILRSGPLEEKQRVLSVITQKYHPGFAGLLEMALRNQDPPIRVQAAAVMARLKEQERIKIKNLMAQAAKLALGADEQSIDLGAQIAGSLESGLLDEQDALSARDLAKALARRTMQSAPSNAAAALQLADLLIKEADYPGAIELLQPLAARGVTEAYPPLRSSLIRLRRFAEAASVPGETLPRTRDLAGPGVTQALAHATTPVGASATRTGSAMGDVA